MRGGGIHGPLSLGKVIGIATGFRGGLDRNVGSGLSRASAAICPGAVATDRANDTATTNPGHTAWIDRMAECRSA